MMAKILTHRKTGAKCSRRVLLLTAGFRSRAPVGRHGRGAGLLLTAMTLGAHDRKKKSDRARQRMYPFAVKPDLDPIPQRRFPG
jgi:hypothetical protein